MEYKTRLERSYIVPLGTEVGLCSFRPDYYPHAQRNAMKIKKKFAPLLPILAVQRKSVIEGTSYCVKVKSENLAKSSDDPPGNAADLHFSTPIVNYLSFGEALLRN